MCSYNALNGVPTCADPYLLQTILREHWGWTNEEQYITSDCDAIQNIYMPHEYRETREESVAAALNAGTDLNCGTYYQELLPGAYAQGLINETTLDQALIRQYSALVRLGYFDGDKVPYRSIGWSDVNANASRQLAYKAAAEGITLLKNDGTLPMKIGSNMTVLIAGDWAQATTQMQGNYAGIAPYLHSPTWALQQTGAKVYSIVVPGGGQGDPTTDTWLPLWNWAPKADLIIFAGGIDNDVESEGMDRVSIAWTGAQLDIIDQLSSYGKPMVVMQMGGGQVDSTPIVNNANISALMWGGYPGQDGGKALIDIVTGKNAPAGRLPITQYPADYITMIPMTDMSLRPNSSSGSPGRTYQWYTGEPVFEYGYGLHYTDFSASIQSFGDSFAISDLMSSCNETYKDKCAFKTISVDVKNTGTTTSDYSTLAFIGGSHGPEPYPNKRLATYTRLHSITGGSTATAKLKMTLGSLGRVDETGSTYLYPGDYSIMIDTQPLAVSNFTLTGSAMCLDDWPQPPTPGWQTSDYFVGGFGSTYGETLLVDGELPSEAA
jgi:beta-D-xylosidase 4